MQQTVAVKAKGWATSKTMIFNIVIVLAGASNEIIALMTASELIPTIVTRWAMLGAGVVNIVLRAMTTQPIASTPVAAQQKPAEVAAPGTPHA